MKNVRQRREHCVRMRGVCALALAMGLACGAPAQAQTDTRAQGWGGFTEENNNLGSDNDRYYVNGFSFDYLSLPASDSGNAVSRTARRVENAIPLLFDASGDRDQRFNWTVLAQQMFTPSDKNRSVPDPSDRPYAGYMYTGLSLMQDTDSRRLDALSGTFGLIGPQAFARQVQNGFHKIFGYGAAEGWSHQLHDEPAFTISYSRQWRFITPTIANGVAADAIPELQGTVGNVYDYAEAGMLVRVGTGLKADYGAPIMQPGISGGRYFNPAHADRPWGLYAFGGFQGRVVGRNIFLDGNSFRSSPSVSKYPFVHDFVAGVTFWTRRAVRLDFVYVARSEEFKGQVEGERYGSVTLSAGF